MTLRPDRHVAASERAGDGQDPDGGELGRAA